MRLLVDHLRVHAVHRGEVVHEFAAGLGRVRQNLAALVRGGEVRERLLDEQAEFHVGACEALQVIRVGHLEGAPCRVDTQGFGKTGVALGYSALVRALELLRAFETSRVSCASSTWDRLANTSAGTGYGDWGQTRVRLRARSRSMTGKCARMIRRETQLARLAADSVAVPAIVAVT